MLDGQTQSPQPSPSGAVTGAHGLIAALLDSCCEHVLETMCFTAVLDHTEPGGGDGQPRIRTRLEFRGNPSGAFELDADPVVGRAIAAGFLGLDESQVSATQTEEVLAEFANMTCGSALSSLDRVEYFQLGTPQTSVADVFTPAVHGVRRGFVLDQGTLSISLRVDFPDSNQNT